MSRLEQIKTNWENGHMNTSDGDWLINRVEELEDFKRSAEQLYKNYHLSAKKSLAEKEELKQQNKRYREALEEILKIQENHEWNLYGLAYGIAERILFDLEESE